MKKIYVFSTLLATFLLVTAASYKATVFMAPPPPPSDTTILVLPEVTHEYKNIPIPEHVFFGGWNPIDTSHLTSITNEGATLGRVLFYDQLLSVNNDLSCGSCHKQEFSLADNVDFSPGFEGELTLRNTPQLNDLGWGPVGQAFFWDMSVASLEELVTLPIVNEAELGLSIEDLIDRLNNTDYYPPLFEDAFGTSNISQPLIEKALAQFISSYCSFESEFDKEAPNDFAGFSSDELEGKQLFDQNCTFCHSTPSSFVTDSGFGFFGNNGLDSVFTDLGMGGWTGDPQLNGVFKGPSLKNIAHTGPYMHDGRFATLLEVIDFYSDEIQPNETSFFNWFQDPSFTGFEFDDAQKQSLLAFLHTLTDENLLTNDKWSDPFQMVTSTDETPPALLTARLYPNPMADYTVVYLNNPNGLEVDLRLNTVDGKQVRHWTTNESEITIKREQLDAGVYFLSLIQEGKTRSLRLVIR